MLPAPALHPPSVDRLPARFRIVTQKPQRKETYCAWLENSLRIVDDASDYPDAEENQKTHFI